MTMTGAEARERELEQQKLERLSPLQRRVSNVRQELGSLDALVDELQQKLDPVLMEVPATVSVQTLQEEPQSSHANDLARMADHVASTVARLRTILERVDL